MHLKFSPCAGARETQVEIVSERSILYDGELLEFSSEAVSWPDIARKSGGRILEAHVEEGDLYLTLLRRYTGSCSVWDTGDYHEVKP